MNAKQTKIVVGIIWIGLLFVGGTNVMNYAVKITTLADISAGTPFQKGMSFTVWANSSFNTTQARQELAEIRSIGVDWVAINHWYYQDYLNSTVIKRGSLSSDSFANMTSCFQYARSIGLHVLYKPMLNLAKTYDWRSYIIYTPDWMGNYTAWMVENAKAAEAGGVEILSIGCEMGNMQVHSDGVRSMIAAIRAVFSGKLTYSANHDSYTFIDWYDAIDIIGISMYTMMSITWNPTILDLKTVWDGIYYELEELALKWNRPVEFTEIGIQARDGSSMIPNDNQLSLVRDVDEMANYYLSLFQSKIWTAPWFKGAHWWIWDDQDPEINPNLDSFNPILLKDLIQAEYTKEHVVEPPTLRLLTMVAPLVSICVVLVLLVWRAGGVLPGDAVGFGKKQKLARNAMLAVNTGGEGNRNDISFGILAGCVIANITTSLTINVYGVIYKSFSYSIILGLSTTETLITFGGLLLAGIVAGLILLRWFPRHALLVAFCLLLFYPFLSIGNPIQTIFVKTLFDLLVLFLLVGALIVHKLHFATRNMLAIVLTAVVVFFAYIVLVIVFDVVAPVFLAIPAGIVMFFMANKQPDIAPDADKPVETDGMKTGKKPRMPIEMLFLGNSLLAGMLIPFGNSVINLVHMNFLSVAMSYLPCMIAASAFAVFLFMLDKKKGLPGWMQVDKRLANKQLLLGGLALAAIGFPFMLLGSFIPVWGVLSGIYITWYLGTLVAGAKKGITRQNVGGGFIYLAVAAVMFTLGFMVNAIKGLLVYTLTFLIFKDGQIVRRDPLVDPVPNFDVPFLLNTFVLAAAILIGIILLLGKIGIDRAIKRGRAVPSVLKVLPSSQP